MAAAHISKLSASRGSGEMASSNRHTSSLVSVPLSEHEERNTDLGNTPQHTGNEITMQFPDETEITRSSVGATQENALALTEMELQGTKSEGNTQNHVDVTQTHPLIEDGECKSNSTKKSSSIKDGNVDQVDLQKDMPSTPITTQFPENEETPKPSTNRTSKVRFDMDQITTQPLEILSADTLNEQEEEERGNMRCRSGSDSSMPQPNLEQHSLEAELERSLQTSRRESEGSSESDSELVDWQELDRTEEEEKRDGATDEVCQSFAGKTAIVG